MLCWTSSSQPRLLLSRLRLGFQSHTTDQSVMESRLKPTPSCPQSPSQSELLATCLVNHVTEFTQKAPNPKRVNIYWAHWCDRVWNQTNPGSNPGLCGLPAV